MGIIWLCSDEEKRGREKGGEEEKVSFDYALMRREGGQEVVDKG